MRYEKAVIILNDLYDFLNARLFKIELPKPQITIQTRGKLHAYGWLTEKPCWTESGQKFYELNICPEALRLPAHDVAAILMHEMCHYANIQNGIQDCSRAGAYHNKEFKRTARMYGLDATHVAKTGYSETFLNGAGKGLIDAAITLGAFPAKTFDLYRDEEPQEVKTRASNSLKYICPNCQMTVRATKAVNVICGDCKKRLELEEKQ